MRQKCGLLADLRTVPVSRDALAKYCAGSSSSW